ncbi:MAG: hypothetical protein IKQ60_05715 [Candidatus Methanomethylophilaceae archaeon]|nr:hypothetical protein [Candidatus Methanomethylophilaceae archaeon]
MELEEDGESAISLKPSGSDKRCEGLLDNVFRLRIPGKGEIILVLNKGRPRRPEGRVAPASAPQMVREGTAIIIAT